MGVIFVSITCIPVGVGEASECVTGNCFDQGQSRALVVTQVMELGDCKAMIRVSCLVEACDLAGKHTKLSDEKRSDKISLLLSGKNC